MNTTSNSPQQTRTVKCPSCGISVRWEAASTWRPFCSERCQLVDFGDWASGRNSIPVEEGPDNLSFPDEQIE